VNRAVTRTVLASMPRWIGTSLANVTISKTSATRMRPDTESNTRTNGRIKDPTPERYQRRSRPLAVQGMEHGRHHQGRAGTKQPLFQPGKGIGASIMPPCGRNEVNLLLAVDLDGAVMPLTSRYRPQGIGVLSGAASRGNGR
jgi:hypothetical protein